MYYSDDFKIKLGLRIKQLRVKMNLTQEQLAELIDRSQRQISLIELGTSCPSLETLMRLKDVFGCSLQDLFDFELVDDINIIKDKLQNIITNLSDEKIKTLYLFAKNI